MFKNIKRIFKLRATIYGRIVYTITLVSIFIFLSFGIIFRTVNERYLNSVITQNGNNICSLVEGALYYSMLENDRSSLQNTLDIINAMQGIEDVNMYDINDNLVHSSLTYDTTGHNNPNCKQCHPDLKKMFPREEKSFKILNFDSQCKMSKKNYAYRLLLIRAPILNDKSCYTSACHIHDKSEKILGSFVIRIPLYELDRTIQKSSSNFLLLAALTTLILLVFLIVFTRKKIINPLNGIIKASEAISNGDKSIRLIIKPNHLYDLRLVSSAFNEMLDHIESANLELKNWSQQLEYKVQKKSVELSEIQNELMHIERISSLGKLSSSVAHEINNPLTGVLTYAKLLQKQLAKIELDETVKEPMLKYLKVIEVESKRCGDIVKGLLDFSRKDIKEFETKHLHKIIGDVYSLMAHQMKMANISFIKDYSAKWDIIQCSENQIKQVCLAILVNSLEAVSESGEITIRTSNPDENTIKIEIEDNGVGISKDDITHIFEPFFSAKQKTSGIGLGLAIVHGIVKSHKGNVLIDSVLDEGTTVSILLPVLKIKNK